VANGVPVLDQLRRTCAVVADRAEHVRISDVAIPSYAAGLDPPASRAGAEQEPAPARRRDQAAFWVTLDAINFGSGWFPTLQKRPGQSGYFTIAGGLGERFKRSGPWSADELAGLTHRDVAKVLGQDPDHELMELFARSLNDLGRHLADEHAGSFEALIESCGGAAEDLVEHLARWDCFSDTSPYRGLEVPFLKRAQITAADLHRAGITRFGDLNRLTMFADNLVPHVLRLDGVLEFDPALVERIERQELIDHGSPEEVEIRACAVHAVELIAAAREDLTAAEIDELLWRRGGEARYKAHPRHRSRCTAY
jgi:Potential Queuosine, Q, salvage protein family